MRDPGSHDGSDREMKQFSTFKPERGMAATNPLYESAGGSKVMDVGEQSTNPLYESADNMTGKLTTNATCAVVEGIKCKCNLFTHGAPKSSGSSFQSSLRSWRFWSRGKTAKPRGEWDGSGWEWDGSGFSPGFAAKTPREQNRQLHRLVSKVTIRFRSNWNLGMVVFEEGGKPENPEKNPQRTRTNNSQAATLLHTKGVIFISHKNEHEDFTSCSHLENSSTTKPKYYFRILNGQTNIEYSQEC